MFLPFLLLLLGSLILLYGHLKLEPNVRNQIVTYALFGYVLRLFVHAFIMRKVFLFSGNTMGGDCLGYEHNAIVIAQLWEHVGVFFVTPHDMPELHQTALVSNLFALVIFLHGAPTSLGCTALVSFLACLTCINLYAFAASLGAEPHRLGRWLLVLLISPGFLYYTSDTYKDGVNAFFVTTAVLDSMKLSKQLTWASLLGLLCSLWAVWYVRTYMVFLCAVPFFCGAVGLFEKKAIRQVLALSLLGAAWFGWSAYSASYEEVSEKVEQTWDAATHNGETAERQGQEGHSDFYLGENHNATYGYALRLLCTLFAPFFWQSGSTAFHIGKMDSFLVYFLFGMAWQSSKRLWHVDRPLLLLFGSFLIPSTFAYAYNLYNIGLIVRQRMPIVMILGVLASLAVSTPPTGRALQTRGQKNPK